MSFTKKFLSIFKTDVKMIRRNPMLLYTVVMTVALLILVRCLKGTIPPQLYFAPAFFTILMIPMVFGMVPGFIMVNEKEEKTIQALQVVPISSTGFLAYRFFWSIVVTVVLGTIAPVILDISISAGPLTMLIVLLVLETMIFSLLVVDFSQTRMQALTLMKIAGWILLLPIVAKFIVVMGGFSTEWSNLTVFLPTHWTYKLYEGIPLGDYGAFWIGLGAHVAWLGALTIIFKKRVL